ncbi:MAG: hypothetical protein E5X35_31700 [Mesorhizobium sp.]|uniref:hypothetical protein n=2 Tax=Mesorhizobium sp. TaxID=1871066 RepID=UPI00120F7C23|nr:hypothetical protein [Mesorhizobium sp.]TIR28178.1 MAG: hypothetical protein E5X35_31700 [Mesorhizobium sp.]
MLARTESEFGHVKTEEIAAMTPDEALLELYRRLADRNAPAPGSFTSLQPAERRAYFSAAKRQSRSRERAAKAAGALQPTTANIREALADAALMILAVDAPGADLVREVLSNVFSKRPGVPVTVQMKARSGKLRPKLVARERL